MNDRDGARSMVRVAEWVSENLGPVFIALIVAVVAVEMLEELSVLEQWLSITIGIGMVWSIAGSVAEESGERAAQARRRLAEGREEQGDAEARAQAGSVSRTGQRIALGALGLLVLSEVLGMASR